MIALTRVALLDTNVLLLLLAGETDRSLLRTFKRINSFTEEDLSLLGQTLRQFPEMMTTPHVLAETSNFVDQAPLYRRRELIFALRHFARRSMERYEAAAQLMTREEFDWLALADTGLVSLSFEAVVLTTDSRLANQINVRGGKVINFTDLRPERSVVR